MLPTDSNSEAPLTPEEEAELDRPLAELLGFTWEYAPDELAPPVDTELLLRFDRRELSPADSRMVIQLIASFRSWHRAWGELPRSYQADS